jgi:V/A-type H+-transporting ATPase subunit G/H
MSNIEDQEQYIKSLEQIKQIEGKVQIEIDERKEEVQNQIKAIDADLEDSITNAENEGRLLVESSIEKARMKANEEAQRTISEAETKAKGISFHYYQTMMKEIMEILISGIK